MAYYNTFNLSLVNLNYFKFIAIVSRAMVNICTYIFVHVCKYFLRIHSESGTRVKGYIHKIDIYIKFGS